MSKKESNSVEHTEIWVDFSSSRSSCSSSEIEIEMDAAVVCSRRGVNNVYSVDVSSGKFDNLWHIFRTSRAPKISEILIMPLRRSCTTILVRELSPISGARSQMTALRNNVCTPFALNCVLRQARRWGSAAALLVESVTYYRLQELMWWG